MQVGTQLHDARRARSLSLGDVSRQTKIQPWVLEALEADRLQELMSPIYVKGFLATYARFLRLAPEPLLAALPWPRPAEPEPEALPPPTPPAVSWSWKLPQIQWPPVPLPLLRRISAVAATAAIVGFIVVQQPFKHLTWPASTPRAATAARKPAAVKVSAKPAPPKPVAEKPAAAKPAAQLAGVAPGVDAVAVKPAVSPTVTLLPTQPLEVEVVARSSTWLQVRADGKLLSQQRLQRGAKERWTARKRLELVLSKPSQVDVFLNGQSISASAITYEGRLLITHYGVARLSGTD